MGAMTLVYRLVNLSIMKSYPKGDKCRKQKLKVGQTA